MENFVTLKRIDEDGVEKVKSFLFPSWMEFLMKWASIYDDGVVLNLSKYE